MNRQDFTTAIRVQIIKRATRADGVVICEECGTQCKRFDIDHTICDGLRIDKSRKLTANDGKLLCSGSRESCHGRKSAECDTPAIARAKRLEAAAISAKPAPKHPIPTKPKHPRVVSDKLPIPPRRSVYHTTEKTNA